MAASSDQQRVSTPRRNSLNCRDEVRREHLVAARDRHTVQKGDRVGVGTRKRPQRIPGLFKPKGALVSPCPALSS
jgi:hypothetical protein